MQSRRIKSLPTALIWIASLASAGAAEFGSTGMTDDELQSLKASTARASDAPEGLKALSEEVERMFADREKPEAARMLASIASGSRMGPSYGWFRPGQFLHDWQWLAAQHKVAADSPISRETFSGPPEDYKRLDRNRDGKLEASDFDWSENSNWVREAAVVNQVFRVMDRGRDSQVSRSEMREFFDAARGESESFNPEDLRIMILGGGDDFAPGDAPTPEQLLKALFAGEIGSIHQGPDIGDPAPDFTLVTQDTDEPVTLSDAAANKPVVLVFGNFTCGPFRRSYPEVELLYQRYKDRVNFLAVYVREAHPEDGWHMASNDTAGVKVVQPKTYDERHEVAGVCREKIGLTMPLLVDGIDDAVGHAYSGMPARLYVIERGGKVAYKSGRGPYGFKTGELEQALLLTLLADPDL